MPVIKVIVRDKIAKTTDSMVLVNTDYEVVFDLDEEWSQYDTKTARFVYGGNYEDKVFSGNRCKVPEIYQAEVVSVGLFAGDIRTTSPALIWCIESILSKHGVPADPSPDVYNQIIEKLNNLEGADPEDIARAVEEYMAENPVQVFNIGDGLKLDTETNTLSVDTATEVEQDNTKPITSAAVYATVGNIEVLLGTI